MANNQYVNKVEYAGQTLVDLTGDTVAPSKVLSGETFHDRSGAPQQGSVITHNVYDGLDSTSADDALSANQGKQLNEQIGSLAQHYTPNNNSNIYTGDLNSLTDSGNWLSTSGTNRPTTSGWYNVTVLKSYKDASGFVLVQIAVNISENSVYTRALNGVTWTGWKRLATNDG